MSRPQAATAFMPISNRGAIPPRPSSASRFMSPEQAAKTHGWYNITVKNEDTKTVATVMIYGEIGWEVSAKNFVKELNALEADEIVVKINSVGGDVFDGVAIYNALRMYDAPVTVYVEGLAASAASFIAQAGDQVIMLRGSEMMIHDASALAWGNEEVMLKTANTLGRISNNIADIYAQRAGGTVEEWRAIMQAEMWYSPEEAVEAGLADEAVDAIDEEAVAAKDSWDLKIFNYHGRDEAPSPITETRKILNRVKETHMVPKMSTDAPSGDENENEQTAQGPNPEGEDVEAQEVPAAEEAPAEEAPVEEEQPAPAVTPDPVASAQNSAGAFFMVNGTRVTDPTAVQAHINTLEGFFNETREQARKDFVASLAEGPAPKILATQIEAMEQLVATFSNDQYEMWKASWEAAPGVALVQQHGGQGGGEPAGTASAQASDRVEILKGVVNQHVLAGASREKIEAMNSYKELVKLDPTFTLETK